MRMAFDMMKEAPVGSFALALAVCAAAADGRIPIGVVSHEISTSTINNGGGNY